MIRIGLGQDSHAFELKRNKPLTLGGVKISASGGLLANSDGDVILHSLCNSLSSAIGGDSLGTWADKMCKEQGITDSKKYIEHVLQKVDEKGFKVENISIAVEAGRPRLKDEQIKMIKKSLSEILLIQTDQIGLTFTSGENLTAFGKGEGIQVLSIVLLKKND